MFLNFDMALADGAFSTQICERLLLNLGHVFLCHFGALGYVLVSQWSSSGSSLLSRHADLGACITRLLDDHPNYCFFKKRTHSLTLGKRTTFEIVPGSAKWCPDCLKLCQLAV